MKIAYWKEDPAAKNIVSHLKEMEITEFTESETSILYINKLDPADYWIIPSTHKSSQGVPAFTVHSTGNWNSAEMGGNPQELQEANPMAMKVGLQSINNNKVEGFEVVMEATHHGPTEIKSPLTFIEIGSSEKDWTNKDAGKIIANAIIDIRDNENTFTNVVGFGGTHYTPNFTRIELENPEIAFGHIAPKYSIKNLTVKIVKEAFEKSSAEFAILDWKGFKSEDRKKVLSILEELGYDYKKSSEL